MSIVYGGIVLVVLLFIAPQVWAFHRNYRAARATGLPIVIFPYDPHTLLHVVFSVPLRPVLQAILPASLFDIFELTTHGWQFRDKTAIHDRLGLNFIIVSPGVNQLICADPAVAQTILARRKDFAHQAVSLKAMGFLGKNIITNNNDDWSRQRRIVAPALSERISSDVWKVSAEHASSLADILLSSGPSTTDTIPGFRAIAINVLTRIAYGHKEPFALLSSSYDPKSDISYVDGIRLSVEFLVLAAFLPWRLLSLPIMPRSVQTLGVALQKLPELTKNMLRRERESPVGLIDSPQDAHTGATHGPETILKTFVRLSDQLKEQAESGDIAAGKSYLTEEEIAGNLFIFTAAGFDTTANTMGYAVTLLAAYPKWQAWVREEIDSVMRSPSTGGEDELGLQDYATTFPRLIRCLAVMFETLRLFPPVVAVDRAAKMNQHIPSGNASEKAFMLEGPCDARVNVVALHTSSSTWGADALEFNPARWIQAADGKVGAEELVTPPRGAFMPWSGGPRNCPGQKMSQVEFVSVFATMFGRCSVEPVPGDGESIQQARQKLLDLTQDSQPFLTLQMNRPKDVHLKWIKRASV
ncbi:cytochrome P450, partial [Periconia macrospinosa]